MLQNAVGEVSELAYVKQISDHDTSRGNPPLVYKMYMELLLSACSTYEKKIVLPGKQKRAVYASEFNSDTYNANYEMYCIDTDVADIMENATDTNLSGQQSEYGNKKTFFLLDQWIKLLQEQKDNLIAERQKERMNRNNGQPRTPYPPRQANAHEVDEVVDIDDIIDYTMLNHDTNIDGDTDKGNTNDGDGFLAYMDGIRKVIATKTNIKNKIKSDTGTSRKVNTSKSTPSTMQVDDNAYYLYKGESIKVDCHQYVTHSTNISYWIVQNDVAGMDYALVACGANGSVWGDDNFCS
jgi:hypothetical protein